MIKNEIQYNAVMQRVEELLKIVGNDTAIDDPNYIELDILSELLEAYEEEHYPIAVPSLVEVIKLRMYELGLTQAKLAELIGVSSPRVSEYLSGKSEPTLQVARQLHKKLGIEASIILG